MEAVLIFGTLAVGLGICAASIGLGRAVAAGGRITGAMESITEDAPDLYRAEMAMPFAQRLLGPTFGVTQRIVRTVTPSWWIERIRTNASLAGLGRLGVEGTLALKAISAAALAVAFLAGSALLQLGIGGGLMWVSVGALVGFVRPRPVDRSTRGIEAERDQRRASRSTRPARDRRPGRYGPGAGDRTRRPSDARRAR